VTGEAEGIETVRAARRRFGTRTGSIALAVGTPVVSWLMDDK